MLTRRLVTNLLGKKKVTGAEVGKLLIANAVYTYTHIIKKKTPKQLITEAEYADLSNRFNSDADISDFNKYVSLSRWTSSNLTSQNAHIGLFNTTIDYLKEVCETTSFILNMHSYMEQLPVIVTQKQYKDLQQKAISDKLGHEDEALDYFYLVEMALHKYLQEYTEEGKTNLLSPIFDKYKAQPITSALILNHYNDIMEIGYRELEDGRRSDQMTPEEWGEAIQTDDWRKMKEGTFEEKMEVSARKLEEEYTGKHYPYIKKMTFHPYPDPPADATKWDILDNDNLLEFYGYDGVDTSDEGVAKGYEDFYNEYKEAVDLLLDEIKERYDIDIKDTPPAEWGETAVPYKILYELDYYGYRADISDDVQTFENHNQLQALTRGVAIIKPGTVSAYQNPNIDERGYYRQPPFYFGTIGIDKFTSINPKKEEALAELDEKLATIEEELYYFKGYDLACQMIAEAIGIKEFTVFSPQFKGHYARVKAMQTLFRSYYCDLKKIPDSIYPGQEERLKILKARFCDIAEMDLEIPKEKIEAARAGISNLSIFRQSTDKLMEYLTER